MDGKEGGEYLVGGVKVDATGKPLVKSDKPPVLEEMVRTGTALLVPPEDQVLEQKAVPSTKGK